MKRDVFLDKHKFISQRKTFIGNAVLRRFMAIVAAFLMLVTGGSTNSHAVSDDILYGISSQQDLYTIDTGTGTATLIGSLGLGQNAATSLATDPVSGNLITFDRPQNEFLEIDPTDGTPNPLSNPGNLGIGGLAFDSSGLLYGTSSLTDDLAIYDPESGQKDIIDSLPFPFSQGLTFNSQDELFTLSEGKELVRIDPNDASINSIGNMNPQNTWLGLAFDREDNLFATRREFTPNGVITELHIVDPENADSQFLTEITGMEAEEDSIIQIVFVQGENNIELIANAGPDQSANEGDSVTLDGTGSMPVIDGLSYNWTQVAGPAVNLDLSDPAQPTFTAPNIPFSQTLRFKLITNKGSNSSEQPDMVDIFVVSGNGPVVGDNLLYGITQYQDLYLIDTETGEATIIGSLGFAQNNAISLAVKPDKSGIITYNRFPNQFFEIDQTNASTMPLADTGNLSIGGLAFNSSGLLYGTSSGTDDLAIYNPTTGQKTVIGPLPFPFSGSLTFNGQEELFAFGEGKNLVRIDTNNASVTTVGQMNPANTWLGLAFDGDDILYATRREFTSSGVITDLHTVNPVNAQNTLLTRITGLAQEGDSVIRIAFLSNRSPQVDADAGLDQTVNENVLVALDGTGSSPTGLNFDWSQVAGPPVTLDLANPASPTFTTPFITSNQTLTFELIVDDGTSFSDPDSVDVVVVNINNPPVADAGDDSSVKPGAMATLNGTNSFDPESDPITYTWAQVAGPTVNLSDPTLASPTFTGPNAVGDVLVFKLGVSDGKESSTLSIGTNSSLADTVAVTIVGNSAPVADAGPDDTRDEGAPVALNGSGSQDPDGGDVISFQWIQTGGSLVTLSNSTSPAPTFDAPAVGTGGQALTFNLIVTDNDSVNPKSASDTVVINVRNANDPPSCDLSVASTDKLWPPNHKMKAVDIDGVMDADATYNNVTLQVTSITQDETVIGSGNGDTSPDAVVQVGDPRDSVLIRAERSGNENGRVYQVNFTASDGFESCAGSIQVTVPRNRKSGAVDDGQAHDSTLP